MPLETRHLTGGYTADAVVHDVALSLQPGEWLSLVGANGSGKSTLLKLMSRILKPQRGTVLLDGQEIHLQEPRLVARKLALLPQGQTVPIGLTVQQLVGLGRSPHQPWWQWELNADDLHQIDTAIHLTRLYELRDRPIEQLSGGERQRAFLALALAQNPTVLLLDEPTTYLDLRYQLQLLELLKQLNQQQGLSIMTVLHDVNLAMRYSDRLALVHQGKLWAIGSPAEVITPANLEQVLGLHIVLQDPPVGLQICPIIPLSQDP